MRRSPSGLDCLNLPALIAVAGWGGSHVATKFALGYLPMLSVVGVRLLGVAPLLLGLAWLVERRLVPRRSDLRVRLVGAAISFAGVGLVIGTGPGSLSLGNWMGGLAALLGALSCSRWPGSASGWPRFSSPARS